MSQLIYPFERGQAAGHADMRDVLGNKGAQLAEMCRLELPVPPGFTISTLACHKDEKGKTLSPAIRQQIEAALKTLEQQAGRIFAAGTTPLLLSVRAGAAVSMPGMLDTILNLGLHDKLAEKIAAKNEKQARFIWDCYRRLVQTYAEAALGMKARKFEEMLDVYKHQHDKHDDRHLTGEDWQTITRLYQAAVKEETGKVFPQSPKAQLWGALEAVFASWHNPRAKAYRHLHGLSHESGTAASVQAMVFGNLGEQSASGVAFTRNPASGEAGLFGEFILCAQGETLVSGQRTPHWLTEKARRAAGSSEMALEELMPEAFAQLQQSCKTLEAHYRDMQDIEFTIEEGVLWILQTRSGKRTGTAALKIALALEAEGAISREEALLQIEPTALEHLLHPVLDTKAMTSKPLARGLGASPGAASGELVFLAAQAQAAARRGRQVILVRPETSPDDIQGMAASAGILTARGGLTSHAAIVARGMGKPCITGAGSLVLDEQAGLLRVGELVLHRGDMLTLDGSSGAIYAGDVPKLLPDLPKDYTQLMTWADEHRRMKVRANVEQGAQARTARALGAQGIGLVRTEYMFSSGAGLTAIRRMILASDDKARAKALAQMLPLQKQGLVDLLVEMAGLPATIRLLDAPLHEFLPREDEMESAAQALGMDKEYLARRVREMAEINPMLGHRGCRLAISHPDICDMQVKAIIEAGAEAARCTGKKNAIEIMVPLVSMREELAFLRERIARAAQAASAKGKQAPQWRAGTMIELPRAALCADALAEEADFFSFGTNDLTQTAFGISREDAAHFLDDYMREGFFTRDPFAVLDKNGVGALMALAVEKGRSVRDDLQIGLAGEHAGDAASLDICEALALDYISCAPWKVPLARLAAAQAFLRHKAKNSK